MHTYIYIYVCVCVCVCVLVIQSGLTTEQWEMPLVLYHVALFDLHEMYIRGMLQK